ncbi:5-(carboxyamino)imidazole ribonucleotide synthase [Spirosomataceae bacterium TFI 002]|nr:5-(carboxyamino)imidazole ribonucleotide synthase [Spirosomataceae bacterium TFI 002]
MFRTKTIGILGGGQLGRMLIQSAIDFDLTIHILDPDKNAPCVKIAHEFTLGDFKDYETVLNFGRKCEIVTIEIENVSIEALFQLEKEGIKVYPQPSVLSKIKNKRIQKQFYADNGIPTAPFELTENQSEIAQKAKSFPIVNKLGEGGYDGRGVQILKSETDLSKAFQEPSLLEELIDFEKELAVIVVKSENGELSTFPVVEMAFHPEANLVEYLFSPAKIDEALAIKASELAKKVAKSFDIIGILAVEMFLTKSGEILVNEVAPRPHNSGHHTQRANFTSQFEQHLRAICGLPLGNTDAIAAGAMVNILGAEDANGIAAYEGMEECLALENVHPFLYGKKVVKPFRKMGHATIIDHDFDKLIEKVNFVKNTLVAKAATQHN